MSVNASIIEELETEMTCIKGWTGVLRWVGCPAECLKNDWNCAYKNQGLHPDDHCLQVKEWGALLYRDPIGVWV